MDTNTLQNTTEEAFVRGLLADISGERVRKCHGWAKSGVLTQPKLSSLMAALEAIVEEGKAIDCTMLPALATRSNLPLQEIVALEAACSAEDEHEQGFAKNREFVHKAFLSRKRREIATTVVTAEDPEELERLARGLEKVARAARGGDAMAGDRFSHLRFDPTRTVSKPAPVLSILGIDVCTEGNIAMLTALQKHGKTAVIGAILAAIMKPSGTEEGDTFGIAAKNPDGLAVLHIDTEQCQFDHHNVVTTAMRRAGISSLPAWVYSYGLLGEGISDILGHLDERLFTVKEKHGGVKFVLLDGAGDLVLDTNDLKESATLVHHLQQLAVRYKCAIICVLHLNPNPNGGRSKSRGHLGSTLERKVEVDLRVIKDADEISTIYTACSRRQPIPELSGPRFKWSPEQGMHASTNSGSTSAAQRKTDDLRILAEEVFEAGLPLKYTEIRDAVVRIKDVRPKSGERWFKILREANLIVQVPGGQWSLAPLTPNTPSSHPQ